MEVEIKQSLEVLLRLNAKEALFIKTLIQNPIGDSLDENVEKREIRMRLWDALPPLSQLEPLANQ